VINNSNCFTSSTDGLEDFKKAFKNDSCEPGYIYEINRSTDPVSIKATAIEEIWTTTGDPNVGSSCSIQKAGNKGAFIMVLNPEKLQSFYSWFTFINYSNDTNFSKPSLQFVSVLADYETIGSGMTNCSVTGRDKLYNLTVNFKKGELNCIAD